MQKLLLTTVLFCSCLAAFAQQNIIGGAPSIKVDHQFTVQDAAIENPDLRFLDLAVRSYELDKGISAAFQTERSIMRYELEPLPRKPYFNFTDRNNFEAIYRTDNLAFYEALRNTAVSQLYNPFSLHKPL